MIVGNFSFNSVEIAEQMIHELVSNNIRINGEFYLDSLIELGFRKRLRIQTFKMDEFLAIGTLEELKTYRYFVEISELEGRASDN